EPDPTLAIARHAGERVHRGERGLCACDRVGRLENAITVDATDPDGGAAVERRASLVVGSGVLAPVLRPLLVRDPDTPAGVDGEAGPSLEVGRVGDRERRSERSVA